MPSRLQGKAIAAATALVLIVAGSGCKKRHEPPLPQSQEASRIYGFLYLDTVKEKHRFVATEEESARLLDALSRSPCRSELTDQVLGELHIEYKDGKTITVNVYEFTTKIGNVTVQTTPAIWNALRSIQDRIQKESGTKPADRS